MDYITAIIEGIITAFTTFLTAFVSAIVDTATNLIFVTENNQTSINAFGALLLCGLGVAVGYGVIRLISSWTRTAK